MTGHGFTSDWRLHVSAQFNTFVYSGWRALAIRKAIFVANSQRHLRATVNRRSSSEGGGMKRHVAPSSELCWDGPDKNQTSTMFLQWRLIGGLRETKFKIEFKIKLKIKRLKGFT